MSATGLVAYASRHGSTREIAERIAATPAGTGCPAEARPVEDAGNLADYEAFVIGSAAYYGHWRKAARTFVRTHAALAGHPVAVVASGARTIIDLPRTLEALETLGVPVVGFGTGEFPAFYARSSGSSSTSTPSRSRRSPISVSFAGVGSISAAAQGVSGKPLTP